MSEADATTPRLHTFLERIEFVKEAILTYEELFEAQAKERQQLVEGGQIVDYPTEEIWFENVTLELNPNPSLYLIDINLRPMMGPRLELHLRGSVGVNEARQQMGRIARYIDARNLSEEFTDISAITYVNLARAAGRLTRMPPAIYTYAPTHISDDAYNRVDGAFHSNKKFLKRHGKPKLRKPDFRLRAHTLPTPAFAERWRDYE